MQVELVWFGWTLGSMQIKKHIKEAENNVGNPLNLMKRFLKHTAQQAIVEAANCKLREDRANGFQRLPMFTKEELAAIERGEPVEIPRAEEEFAYLTKLRTINARKRAREESHATTHIHWSSSSSSPPKGIMALTPTVTTGIALFGWH
jgi:hypothetical protein